MNSKYWAIGLGIGAAVGLFVASAATFMDWHLNAGGIFHDAEHTDWAVVWETAVSWFVPVAATVAVLALLVFYVVSRRQ